MLLYPPWLEGEHANHWAKVWSHTGASAQYFTWRFYTLFQTQCFYTLSVHSDTYNKNILITMKDNPTDNYIIILILTKIVKELDSAIVIVDIQ